MWRSMSDIGRDYGSTGRGTKDTKKWRGGCGMQGAGKDGCFGGDLVERGMPPDTACSWHGINSAGARNI